MRTQFSRTWEPRNRAKISYNSTQNGTPQKSKSITWKTKLGSRNSALQGAFGTAQDALLATKSESKMLPNALPRQISKPFLCSGTIWAALHRYWLNYKLPMRLLLQQIHKFWPILPPCISQCQLFQNSEKTFWSSCTCPLPQACQITSGQRSWPEISHLRSPVGLGGARRRKQLLFTEDFTNFDGGVHDGFYEQICCGFLVEI